MLRALPVKAPSMAWGPAWTSPWSTVVQCRTEAGASTSRVLSSTDGSNSGTRFMRVYRISEYSFDVDFLQNHDAATIDAMPLYLMTCDVQGDCGPWDAKKQSPYWDECHEAIQRLCPNSRGAAFNCMECADANREQLTSICGNWTDQDKMAGDGSFAIHWWCGVGWPESAAIQGPITEYCVEYQPLAEDTRMGDGFSDYLSCNSDETDGTLGNDPRDPSCMCIVWDDRLLAHQTNESWLKEDCYEGHMAWLSETVCNCTGQTQKTPIPQPGNPSLTHIGRMPVYLPYVGIDLKPHVPGDPQFASGYNFHFPTAGACDEGMPIGTNGCTWRRHPMARMIYGANLLDAGWDLTFVPDTPTDMTHTKRNSVAFKAAFDALDSIVHPAACGSADAAIVI